MGLIDWFKARQVKSTTKYKMITDQGGGYYSWNGKLYHSDIVRAAIRPKVQAVGKAVGKHIRDGVQGKSVNPDVYMRFLLEEPNPYMSGQQLQEKLATQLELNNNAFAFIERDTNDLPSAVYPITAVTSEAVTNDAGELFLRFTLKTGVQVTFKYKDVIHLRKDFYDNEIFGDSPAEALAPLMEVVNTTDQGIVKAIKNSNVIRWLMQFNQTLRPEDLKANADRFRRDFLDTNNDEDGVAATDAKADLQQVEPKDYVPNEKQMERSTERIYSFFNVNKKIVQSSYNEDEWIAFYEASVEPIILQMSHEYSRKLFTRRERGFGNKIMFDSSNLAFASMRTKLDLREMVDRGAMTPNEWREVLNMTPLEGGDTPIRRLDTRPASE